MRLGAYVAELAPGLAGGRGLRQATSCPSATATATSSTPGTAPGSRRPACCARASRPTVAWSSSSSCPSHPFWVGTQAHPEFKSRPDRPAPLFREFVGAALARAEGRNPHLDPARRPSRRPSGRWRADRPAPEPARPRPAPASTKRGEREIWRGAVISVAEGTFAAPDGDDVRARRRPPPRRGVGRAARLTTARWCSSASTGPPSTRTCWRSPPASATSPARTPEVTGAPGAGGGGRAPAGTARAAGRVLQLAGLLRRALPRLPRPPTSTPGAHGPPGHRGGAHDHRARRASTTCPP